MTDWNAVEAAQVAATDTRAGNPVLVCEWRYQVRYFRAAGWSNAEIRAFYLGIAIAPPTTLMCRPGSLAPGQVAELVENELSV
jgi:hypothetical protein